MEAREARTENLHNLQTERNGASLGKEFSRHALPLTELTTAVEALESTKADYSSAKARRASAIQEFGCTVAEAVSCLHRLDAIVEITLSDNPTAVASWSVTRKVSRTAARKREVQPPAPVGPPTPDPPVTPVPVVESAAAYRSARQAS